MGVTSSYKRLLASAITEGFGSLFFAFAASLAGVTDAGGNAVHSTLNEAFIVGVIVAILVYGAIDISGGHFNPAITVGVALTNNDFGWTELLFYVFSQFVGAIIGALIAMEVILKAEQVYPSVGAGVDQGQAALVEIIFAFILVFTVLRTGKKSDMFGFYIGLVLFVGILAGKNLSGASFNPAISMGMYISSASIAKLPGHGGDDAWVYIVAPLIGGSFAAFYNSMILTLMGDKDYCKSEKPRKQEIELPPKTKVVYTTAPQPVAQPRYPVTYGRPSAGSYVQPGPGTNYGAPAAYHY